MTYLQNIITLNSEMMDTKEDYITTCHSKQLLVGLMVLSDGMVHFLKIEKIFKQIYQKLSCGFKGY